MPTHRRMVESIHLSGLVLIVAACSGGPVASEPAGPPAVTAPARPPAASPPGDGGSVPGDPGTGVLPPIGPGPVDPGPGRAEIQIPRPGRLDPHPVAPISLESSVDGRRVLVKVSWYGGVAPCSVLDSVKVERSGTTIALTVLEGADALDVMCPEIAMLKATIVDLGELEPGTWTITAPNSDARPIELTLT